MLDRIARLALACLAVAALSGCAAAAASSTATAAGAPISVPSTSTPAPSTNVGAPTGGNPIQIILPSTPAPATSIGIKDFLIPLGALLGAAVAFGGAVTGARLAANAQDKRARQDAEIKRHEEERARVIKRLEAFADQASSLVGDAAALAGSKAEAWNAATAVDRDALRLRAAQMLGNGHLLDADLRESVREFIGSALEVSNAPTVAQARQVTQRCGATFEALMRAIGGKLQSTRSMVDPLDAKQGTA